MCPETRPSRRLGPPSALLFDFGGVLVDGPVIETWHQTVAAKLVERIGGTGTDCGLYSRALAALHQAEDAAAVAVRQGDDSDLWAPAFWLRCLHVVCTEAEVQVVVPHLVTLTRWVSEAKYSESWKPRPGVGDLLLTASELGLPMAVVSNAICGANHRDVLTAAGWSGFFEAQIYSDEVGVRKPSPAIVQLGAEELGVEPRSCWFVGDSLAKDVVAARRADCGAVVLMRSNRPDSFGDGSSGPDVYVDDPFELRNLLLRSFAQHG